MASVTISSATVGGSQPNAPTGLTTTTAFDGVQLDWVNPTNTPIEYIQIASSTTNNVAAGFTTVANVKTTAFYDHSTMAGNVFYWVRAVSTLGNIGPWNAADTAGTVGSPQEVTITAPARGQTLVYTGTLWANSSELAQNINANAAPTFTRETTSTTLRTAARIRKTLTSGSRTNNDGPVLAFSYTDTTGGYDYGALRFRYSSTGDHDLVAFTSTDTANTFATPTTLFIAGANTAVFTGAVQSTNAANAIGYGTGAGGTVTQLTSKVTPVTIDTPTGEITMHNSSLASGFANAFVVNNSTITATDAVVVNIESGAAIFERYGVFAGNIQAGSFSVWLRNFSGVALAESVVVRYAIIKGSNT